MATTLVNLVSLYSPDANIVVTKPTDTQENDLLLCFFSKRGTITNPISIPSGWTQLATSTVASTYGFWVFYKVAGSSEPSTYTWEWGLRSRVTILAYRGNINPTDPIDVFSNTIYDSSNNVARAASITVSENSSTVLFLASAYDTTGCTFQQAGTFTEQHDAGDVGSDLWQTVQMNELNAGATGNIDSTLSITTVNKHAFLIAFNPYAGATAQLAKVDGIALTAIAKYDGIAKASIAKIDGLTIQ